MVPWSLVDGLVAFQGRLYISPGAPFSRNSSPWCTTTAMKASNAPCTACAVTSTHPTYARWSRTTSGHAPHSNTTKSEHLHPAGLLHPLLVPMSVWTDIRMDFIEALPRVSGKSVILTIVDHFSKY